MEEQAIHEHPRIQGGVPVFPGTRVPVKNLFDYLESGESLEQFLSDFPAVDRAKAIAALESAREALDRRLTRGKRSCCARPRTLANGRAK